MTNYLDLIDSCIIWVVISIGLFIASLVHQHMILVYCVGMIANFISLYLVAGKHIYDEKNNIAD